MTVAAACVKFGTRWLHCIAAEDIFGRLWQNLGRWRLEHRGAQDLAYQVESASLTLWFCTQDVHDSFVLVLIHRESAADFCRAVVVCTRVLAMCFSVALMSDFA